MLSYRVATDGRDFRVEMFDPGNAYKEWLPIAGPYPTRALADAARDRCVSAEADRVTHPWVPVEAETQLA